MPARPALVPLLAEPPLEMEKLKAMAQSPWRGRLSRRLSENDGGSRSAPWPRVNRSSQPPLSMSSSMFS
ncbi:MAG: hypothetical protein ACREPK_01170 [Rhodanobacteraceae bacterium]